MASPIPLVPPFEEVNYILRLCHFVSGNTYGYYGHFAVQVPLTGITCSVEEPFEQEK